MASSRNEAVEMLAQADAARRAVRSRAVWAYRGYFAWALWLLVFLPPLDFLNHKVWAPIVLAGSMVGTLLSVLYFATRMREVHLARASQTRRWVTFWAAWAPWYVACVVAARLLEPRFALAWTSAAVAAALPVLIAAFRGWRSR